MNDVKYSILYFPAFCLHGKPLVAEAPNCGKQPKICFYCGKLTLNDIWKQSQNSKTKSKFRNKVKILKQSQNSDHSNHLPFQLATARKRWYRCFRLRNSGVYSTTSLVQTRWFTRNKNKWKQFSERSAWRPTDRHRNGQTDLVDYWITRTRLSVLVLVMVGNLKSYGEKKEGKNPLQLIFGSFSEVEGKGYKNEWKKNHAGIKN